MNWMKRITLAASALTALALPLSAQTTADTASLLVVYGVSAPSSEGDVDHREQILFSIPENTPGRVYVRLFDPETSGNDDFTYGGPRDSLTTYRIMGGEGAFTGATRPALVQERERPARISTLATDPGKVLAQSEYGYDKGTDGRWVTLGTVRARQGEIMNGRAYFRIDVDGTAGNDGNGFSVAVSTVRDRNRAPKDLSMFAYQPTIRWSAGTSATRVTVDPAAQGPFKVQNFDGAKGDLTFVTDYTDIPLQISGQNYWSIDSATPETGALALSLKGGFETPNDVTVSVFDKDGAAVALQMPPVKALDPARPTALGTASPLADCRAVAFDASPSKGRVPLSYIWDFGDGKTADQSVIAHRYDAPGRYTATLKVMEQGTRAGRGSSVAVPVHVRSGPTAKPGDPITVAPGQVVPFDGSTSEPSDSPISRYIWSFGDGTGAAGSYAEKTYDKPGTYRSNLRVEDNSDHPCNFGVETRLITVNFAPVAEAGTDQTAETGQTLLFDASASYDVDGALKTYVWDMGDGTIIEGARISHTYTKPDTYYATLTVKDDSGVENNYDWDQLIVVVNAPPEPMFTIPDRPVSVSEAAQLSAEASVDPDGSILSYMWDFGDGALGDGENVEYAWTAPGVYTVTLTVTDDSGTASAIQKIEKQIVIDAAPTANAGPAQFVTASEVQFDGTGSSDPEGGITSYEWDFGDGQTGNGPTPVHAYARPGIYEVALVVRDESTAPLNVDRATTTITINATPIADAGPPLTVAPNEEFILSGRASLDPDGRVSTHEWSLPDGTSQSAERIAVALASPGLYRFGLTVKDGFSGGPAADTAETLITVNAAPVAEAGADMLVAPGDPVRFDGGLSYDTDGEIISYMWEFDDGVDPVAVSAFERTYTTPGVWSAQLVVTDDSGVTNATDTDDLTIRVNHAPVAEAGPRLDTEVLQVSFDGSASSDADGDALIYLWDFGDGSAPMEGAQVTHVYEKSGIYPVTLRVNDGTGLKNAKAIDTTVVTIKTRPIAMAGGNKDVCSGQPILFDASDSSDPDGSLLLYSWDFGDGETSDLVNPSKTYEQPGAYPVTLTVRNGTGTDWGTAVDRIAALIREGPISDAGEDMTVCTNQAVRFDGSGSTDADGAVNSFAWTFGDGGTASGERPEYRFKKPGNYVVNLTITGEALGACSPLDTDTVNVEVVAAPAQAIVGSERAAAGMPANFSIDLSDLEGASVISHNWIFSDGTTAEGAEVSHTFETPGVYFATLKTELSGGNQGCSTIETTRKVVVNEAPAADIKGPQSMAAGEAVIFDAGASKDADGVIINYAWDFGDGNTSEGLRPAHRFAEAGTYRVALTVTDDAGVGNSRVTREHEVVVNPAPVADLEAPQWICPAVELPWAVDVPSGTEVAWIFGDTGVRAEGANVTYQFANSGLYPVSVALDDGKNLANSQRREERYVRVNAAPTALAGPDRVVCPGDVTVFDAGASGDLDGLIEQFEWKFSDGVTLTGPRVERSFDTAGPVTVDLVVTDNSGLTCGTGTDRAAVLVNHTPSVDAGPDITTKLGAAHDVADFDASNASDADGQGLDLQWSYGDGTTGTGAVTRHRYATPGTYTVTVEARDTTGLACGVGRDTALVTALPRN
ncbi:PKD domain-containing protein [Sulfitobacter mediterraneus]|uniref:PKD domain-containing protein n=1 Tax=Sulfitobacter mediterraneus TaxID=83219 RepID=UPI0021A7D5C3|nr:PKD domain-containing protein [Sulfitobacter mediterraneus]UWR11607.1 PKD domain-containing protein [Sulfitobacter mediterraneus]